MTVFLSDDVLFSWAEQTAKNSFNLNDLPTTGWNIFQPDTVDTYTAAVTKTTRRPVGSGKQRKAGRVTQISAGFGFTGAATWDSSIFACRGISYSDSTTDITIWESNVSASSQSYSIGALTTAQRDRLSTNTLLYARGFTNGVNNGLKILAGTPSSGQTTLTVTGLASETARPEHSVEVAGFRANASDVSYSIAPNGDLVIAATNLDFTEHGLIPGQMIYIGGDDLVNKFTDSNGNAIEGLCIIRSIASGMLTLSHYDSRFTGTNGGSGKRIDFYFPRVFRNLHKSDDQYSMKAYAIELRAIPDEDNPVPLNEYAMGNIVSQTVFNISSGADVSLQINGVGLDIPDAVDDNERPGGQNRRDKGLVSDESYAYGGDIEGIVIYGPGLTEDITAFRSAVIDINRNCQGSFYADNERASRINDGAIDANATLVPIFRNNELTNAIRSNAELGFYAVFANEEGAVAINFPRVDLSDGSKNITNDQEIEQNITAQAVLDENGYSFLLNLFPYLPASFRS